MNRPYWECACGDTAPVDDDDGAIAGAAGHHLWHKGEGHLRHIVFAYGVEGEVLEKVQYQTVARSLKSRYLKKAQCCPWAGYAYCQCNCAEPQALRSVP